MKLKRYDFCYEMVEQLIKDLGYRSEFRLHVKDSLQLMDRGLIMWMPGVTPSYVWDNIKSSKSLDIYVEHAGEVCGY